MTAYEMIRDAMQELGGKASYPQLKAQINATWQGVNENTINGTCLELSVNSNSRTHYGTNVKPRLTFPPSKYDVLFHVSDGNVELYDPKKHGIWEIYADEGGKKKVRKVGLLNGNTAILQVRNWSEITDNLYEFGYVSKDESRPVYKRLSSFFHWYYFPKQDSFAPSKFLGYLGTTAENYQGYGHGGETNKALTQFFIKLDKDSKQFKQLHAKLELQLSELGKEVNAKVVAGSGGIYVPKEDVVTEADEISQELYNTVSQDIDSLESEYVTTTAKEGARKPRLVNQFERSAKLRAKAVKHHGTKCHVCQFDFGKTYGDHGKDFIEIHHIRFLSGLEQESDIDFIEDMVQLCANCHRMVHRKRDEPLSIKDLVDLYNRHK